MVTAPTAEGLYASAQRFAQSTLEAHHKGDHQRVAIDAGTALEHLTKACLARRSPALLVELRPGPNNWASLVLLCGFPEGQPKQVRTVGLREAHERLKTSVSSVALKRDLALLIDLRDGVVHAAVNEPVEERILVAFVQQAEAIVADIGKPRKAFWKERIGVVDALLADAVDKVKHRVGVKLEAAKAAFQDKYAGMRPAIRNLIVRVEPRFDEIAEAATECPACGSKGVATGKYSLEEEVQYYEDDPEPSVFGMVRFTAKDFFCQLCGLRLTTPAELVAAGVPGEWDVPEIDVADFVESLPFDDPISHTESEWAELPK
jgi:hypothetical protein